MRFFAVLSIILISLSSLSRAQQEHVILCGGPSLQRWEKLRVERDRHDRWWANFIRASTLRMDEIRRAYGPQAKLTWIVYRNGYAKRSREDGKPYIKWIEGQASKRSATLIWINTGSQAIDAINSRPKGSIRTFDYFGHSNKHCFMLDYGSDVMAVSQAWIHEDDIPKIKPSVFSRKAHCQSWGCHTGESMSKVWNSRMGNVLVGAAGKTDYVPVGQGHMPSVSGTWVR